LRKKREGRGNPAFFFHVMRRGKKRPCVKEYNKTHGGRPFFVGGRGKLNKLSKRQKPPGDLQDLSGLIRVKKGQRESGDKAGGFGCFPVIGRALRGVGDGEIISPTRELLPHRNPPPNSFFPAVGPEGERPPGLVWVARKGFMTWVFDTIQPGAGENLLVQAIGDPPAERSGVFATHRRPQRGIGEKMLRPQRRTKKISVKGGKSDTQRSIVSNGFRATHPTKTWREKHKQPCRTGGPSRQNG